MSDSDPMPFDDGKPQTRLYRRNGGDALPRSEFWMRIAGVAFGLWALMIPIGIAMVRSAFADLVAANLSMASEFGQYRLATERRLTLLEDRQNSVIALNAEQQAALVAHADRLARLEQQRR